MAAVLVTTVMAISVTARLGGELIGKARAEAIAEAVALASTTEGREGGELVAAENEARIVEFEIHGDSMTGFDATVTVENQGRRARARASTRLEEDQPMTSTFDRAVPGSGTGVLR